MPRIEGGPRDSNIRTIKRLANRLAVDAGDSLRVSVEDGEVPSWQRQSVWTNDEMGLLALSIVFNYPIGLVILWRKPDGIRVPIDGRQRLTAVKKFFEGAVAIPDLPGVPEEYKNRKYRLLEGEEATKYSLLPLEEREAFEEYTPQIVEFDDIDETTAMDVFIKLQGGKSLTKTEVRAALGGRCCDFVTELTSPPRATTEGDEEEDEPGSRHPFFRQVNVRNVRKAHRNLCDVLLHEHLYPTRNKHWSSLEMMYRDKAGTLTDSEKATFKTKLGRFQRASSFREGGHYHLLPQLRSAFLILSFYRAWRELEDVYATSSGFRFAAEISEFETQRERHKKMSPWLNFSAALSNAGYSEGRIQERHEILMSYILRRHPEMPLKDRSSRLFSEAQKLAIWDRSQHQCEYVDEAGGRCPETFADFRAADADHIRRWVDGGPTTIANGRLLCQPHNRGRAREG